MDSLLTPPHKYYFNIIKMWNEQLFDKLFQAITNKETNVIKREIIVEMRKSEMPKNIVKDMILYIRSI